MKEFLIMYLIWKRIIKLVISLIFLLIRECVYFIYRISGKRNYGSFVILYYHEILLEQRKKFAAQMKIVSSMVKPVSIEFDGILCNGDKYASITFDDAFQSIIENGLEVLLRF